MLIRSLLVTATLAGLFLAGQVQAGPIYNWTPISYSETIESTSGMIELADGAVQGNGLNYSTNGFIESDSTSPVLNFTMTVNGKTLEISPRGGPGSGAEFSMDLTLSGGTSPAGSIYANNTESDITFSGDSSLWTITRFGSDDPAAGQACHEAPGCSGATGRWLLAGAPVAVPAPPAGLLFTLGLGVLGFVHRRARRRVH